MNNNQNYLRTSSKGYEALRPEDLLYTENRVIFFNGEVTPESCQELISKLIVLDQHSHDRITLLISSPGGDVFSGYAMIDAVNAIESPVDTVCVGVAASAAALLFICGEKRYILENSRVLIHDAALAGGIDRRATAAALTDEIKNLKELHDMNRELIRAHSRMTVKEIEKALSGDTWFSVRQALDKGLADEVLDKLTF